jgi:ubiquinone/menaquinone biosynthesis C-methylase UbiE
MEAEELYRQRFADVSQEKRAAMWEVLCRVVLQRYVEPTDTVVDLGAGFCEFINTIRCEHKVAIDASPASRQYAAEGVHAVVGDVHAVLGKVADATVNVVFCSNFFEHLRNKEAVLTMLSDIYRVLVPEGRVIIIQPNIRYAYKEYWDFFDHHVPLSHRSLGEALQLSGFRIDYLKPRFLPYTTKSRLPQAAWLMRLYLAVPPAQWLLGKQMLVVARKRVSESDR